MGIIEKIKKSLKSLSIWSEKKDPANASRSKTISTKARKLKKAMERSTIMVSHNNNRKKLSTRKRIVRRNKKTARLKRINMKKSFPPAKGKKPVMKRKVVKKLSPKGKKTGAKKVILPIREPKRGGEVLLGTVTHFFPKVKAAAMVIEYGSIKRGDSILVRGETTNFKQKIKSLQIDRKPIETAKRGDEIGIEVKKRVREGDKVFKLDS